MANRGPRTIRFNPEPARKPIEADGRQFCPQCGGLLTLNAGGAAECFCGFIHHADPLPVDWTMFVPKYSMHDYKIFVREQAASK